MKHLNTNQIFYEPNLIKTPLNTFSFSFKGSFSIKLTKICHKNRGEALASIPLYLAFSEDNYLFGPDNFCKS